MKNNLTSYAIGHLAMIEIEHRFNKVIARHPKHRSENMNWRINMAKDSALIQRFDFQDYLNHYTRSTK